MLTGNARVQLCTGDRRDPVRRITQGVNPVWIFLVRPVSGRGGMKYTLAHREIVQILEDPPVRVGLAIDPPVARDDGGGTLREPNCQPTWGSGLLARG